jgi:hypothetical protein
LIVWRQVGKLARIVPTLLSENISVLNLQVFILTLMPLLSGTVPGDGRMPIGALSFLGIGDSISAEFLVGNWQYSDEFFKWGITDKDRAEVRPFRGRAFMSLERDGTMKMINLFRPAQGRWELTDEGIVLFDPRFTDRVAQILPVRKRDHDRIWLLLPFTGGASGIGMKRISEEEMSKALAHVSDTAVKRKKRHQSSDSFSD